MSVKINYSKVDNPQDAYAKVKENITPETMERYKVNASFDYNDSANKIKAKGKGFELNMDFHSDHATINLELSFLLKAFKQKILDSLERQIGKVI